METRKHTRLLIIGFFGILGSIAILALSGCLEHQYTYKINLDGTVEFNYKTRGDSADIYDLTGNYPEAPQYRDTTYTELDTTGARVFVLEARALFPPDSLLPTTLGRPGVPWNEFRLQHPTKVSRQSYFLLTVYKFNETIAGRDRTTIEGDRSKYIPPECAVLENGQDSLLPPQERALLKEKYAAGTLMWNVERYKLRFREIIRRAQAAHKGISLDQERVDSALAALDSLTEAHLASIKTEDLDLTSLSWWQELAPAAHALIGELSTEAIWREEVARTGELLEIRQLISDDINDESFEIRVDMPGRVMKSNSKAMEKGVLIWKYAGTELQENDVVLQATSFYLHTFRIISVLVLLFAGLLVLLFRRANAKKSALRPPPPPPGIKRGSP